MTVETASDRLFMLADFGVSAIWGGKNLTVIYDNDFFESESGFATSQPRATCRSSDVAGAAQGDPITVDGRSYIIRVVMDDGTGVAVLVLEKQ